MPINIRTIANPEKLQELSETNDLFTLMDIAGNPHTPIDTLIKLSQTQGDVRVPAFAFRNPNFPVQAAIEFINQETKGDSYVFGIAVHHPELPYELLLKLAQENTNDDNSIRAILTHQKVTLEILEAVLVTEKNNPELLLSHYDLGFSHLTSMTKEMPILSTIYKNKPRLAHEVASNKYCDSTLLDKIAREQPIACSAVAKHKNVLPSTLNYLTTHEYIWTRTKVAWNPKTEIADLEFLSFDKEPKVREAVAKNKNTPSDVLDRLEDDRSLPVRRAAIANKIKREL